MSKLPDIICSKDIVLQNALPTQENSEILFHLIVHNRNELSPFFKIMISEANNYKETYDYLLRFSQSQKREAKIYFIKKNDKVIGEISARSEKNTIVVGYWIDKDYKRQGITTQALKMLERAVFAAGYDSVTLNIAPVNTPSLRLAFNCGYRRCTPSDFCKTTYCFIKTKQMYMLAPYDNVDYLCSYRNSNICGKRWEDDNQHQRGG